MRKIISISLVFLTACSSSPVLPDKEQSLDSFIPKEENQATTEVDEFKQSAGDFSTKNFPSKCKWMDLNRVVDGDTIIAGKDTRVRFVGMDTPETVHPKKSVEKWGPEASEKTKELLANSKKVCLINDEIGNKYDIYGRKLAYVFSEEGTDIEAVLLREGLAKGYYRFPFERKDEFKIIENEAKIAELGIWSK